MDVDNEDFEELGSLNWNEGIKEENCEDFHNELSKTNYTYVTGIYMNQTSKPHIVNYVESLAETEKDYQPEDSNDEDYQPEDSNDKDYQPEDSNDKDYQPDSNDDSEDEVCCISKTGLKNVHKVCKALGVSIQLFVSKQRQIKRTFVNSVCYLLFALSF